MEYAACIISRVLLACVRVFLGAFASRARVLSRRGKYNDGERAELRAYVRTSRELALETGDKEGVSTAAIMIALSGSLTPVHRCTEPHVASAVHRCSGCTSRRVHMHRTALCTASRHACTRARTLRVAGHPPRRAELEKEGNNERVPCTRRSSRNLALLLFFFSSLSLSFPLYLYTNTFYVWLPTRFVPSFSERISVYLWTNSSDERVRNIGRRGDRDFSLTLSNNIILRLCKRNTGYILYRFLYINYNNWYRDS